MKKKIYIATVAVLVLIGMVIILTTSHKIEEKKNITTTSITTTTANVTTTTEKKILTTTTTKKSTTKKTTTTKPKTTTTTTSAATTTTIAEVTEEPVETYETYSEEPAETSEIYSEEPVEETYYGDYSPYDLQSMGVISWGGYRYTYYSELVLPGDGLAIEGRHVDEYGFVCDGENYICVASGSLPWGSVVNTPFGKMGKVYDCGCDWDVIDCYVSW